MYTSSNNGILPAVAWTQSDAPSLKWSSVASSSDGKKLAAVAEDGGIYISNNSGVSWKLSSAPSKFSSVFQHWVSITSSSDGTKLAAVVFYGGIYTSNDGGLSWTLTGAKGYQNWISIASSSDGSMLAAAAHGGGHSGDCPKYVLPEVCVL